MKLPLIVCDTPGDDLSIHDSIEEAEIFLEAIDVRNNEYVAFDAQGNVLILEIEKVRQPTFFGLFHNDIEMVRIREAEPVANKEDELRQRLIDYILCFQKDSDLLVNMKTPQLVEIAWQFEQQHRYFFAKSFIGRLYFYVKQKYCR